MFGRLKCLLGYHEWVRWRKHIPHPTRPWNTDWNVEHRHCQRCGLCQKMTYGIYKTIN